MLLRQGTQNNLDHESITLCLLVAAAAIVFWLLVSDIMREEHGEAQYYYYCDYDGGSNEKEDPERSARPSTLITKIMGRTGDANTDGEGELV